MLRNFISLFFTSVYCAVILIKIDGFDIDVDFEEVFMVRYMSYMYVNRRKKITWVGFESVTLTHTDDSKTLLLNLSQI